MGIVVRDTGIPNATDQDKQKIKDLLSQLPSDIFSRIRNSVQTKDGPVTVDEVIQFLGEAVEDEIDRSLYKS